jgi:hypothetical protein
MTEPSKSRMNWCSCITNNEFYRKGGRPKHTNSEIAEFEKRRDRVRALFAELEQVRNMDSLLLEPDEPMNQSCQIDYLSSDSDVGTLR